MNRSSNGLQIGNSGGYSLGYFVIPYSKRDEVIESILEALERAKDDIVRKRRLKGDQRSLPPEDVNVEFYSLMGRCDLLVVVQQKHGFNFSNDLQNQLLLFQATRSTWIHAVKYIQPFPEVEPHYSSGMLFQLFLTAKRSLYRHDGQNAVDTATIVASELNAMLRDEMFKAAFRLNLYTTLGWADCLLWGSFHGTPGLFNTFMGQLEDRFTVKTEDGPEQLFRRRLTMAGYKLNVTTLGAGIKVTPAVPKDESLTNHQLPQPRCTPLVLARGSSGEFLTAQGAIKDYVALMHRAAGTAPGEAVMPTIRSVDGKWDFVASFDKKDGDELFSLGQIAYANHRFANPGSSAVGVIDRTESHMLVDTQSDSRRASSLFPPLFTADISREDDTEKEKYLTGRVKKTWEVLLKLTSDLDSPGTITGPLRNEIAAVLSLLALIARDEDNRQFVDYVIHGAIDALQELIKRLETVGRWSDYGVTPEVRELYITILSDLRTWCSVTGRALRQRASGSFANLFNQPLSVPAMRGSLQKMLLTADGLMREFFGFLPSGLTDDPGETLDGLNRVISPWDRRPPRLASAFVPTVRIASLRYLHIVEIPSRHAFSLQRVLPQLWHEVGQCIFFRLYNPFVSTLQHDFNVALNELGSADFASRRLLLRHISDHFSDVLVSTFGFARNMTWFTMYLSRTLSEAVEESAPGAQQARDNFLVMLERILVAEAATRCLYEGRISQDAIFAKITLLRRQAKQELLERFTIAQQHFQPWKQDSRDIFDISDEICLQLLQTSHERIDQFISQVLAHLLSFYDSRLDFNEQIWPSKYVDQGRVTNLGPYSENELSNEMHDSNLLDEEVGDKHGFLANELYRIYYLRWVKSKPSSENTFQSLAGVGFTALQSFKNRDPYFRGIDARVSRLQAP